MNRQRGRNSKPRTACAISGLPNTQMDYQSAHVFDDKSVITALIHYDTGSLAIYQGELKKER